MFRKKVSAVLVLTLLTCSVAGINKLEVNAATKSSLTYSFSKVFDGIKDIIETNDVKEADIVYEEEIEVIVENEIVVKETETVAFDENEEEYIKETQEILMEENITEENLTEEIIENEVSEVNIEENTKASTEEIIGEVSGEGFLFEDFFNKEIVIESDVQKMEIIVEETTTPAREEMTEETVEQVTIDKEVMELNNNIAHYKDMAEEEAKWLWKQQLSNGAFAFYNEVNGSVYINPYFSEIVAIALIGYDNSDVAKFNIERYFEWHFSHVNTAKTDYNGLAGTIYDYDVVVENGVVVSETSRNVYDSTDSYSALFIKALADYVKTYNDASYLLKYKDVIKDITNVMFATMSNGYTYAKPDYPIIYLMDNAEVYAGLKAAEYIYGNVIDDDEMYEKICNAVEFYEENFNNHWWKGDHYAAVLNPDYSEYTGFEFSWNEFYPCATSQMFPILYGVIEADSEYAQSIYESLSNAWEWQDMDYISKGATVFCWGNFAYLGALVEDTEKLNLYMEKYNEIVESGRPYPLYSSESAMVLMGCSEMIKNLEFKLALK